MKKRLSWHARGCTALAALGLGCGADSVNVGDRPELGGDLAGSPDAGGSLVEGSTSCNIPNLGQYRLLFDSDGGRLERRIYSMRADGTEIEPITPPEELAREPALSPDGQQLAYVTPEGIRLRDMDSGQSELLVADADLPEWMPDGVTLRYRWTSLGNPNCIGTMTMSDRMTQPDDYWACGSYTTALDVSPDGSQIVLADALQRDGFERGYGLQLVGADGVSRIVVPVTATSVDQPTISPDGTWVAAAYQCAGAELHSLWASPLQVSTPACEGRRITAAGSPSATNPQWGPGTLIAYERGEPPRDIAIIAADTGEECVIEGPGDDRNPSWGILPPSVPE